MESLRETAMWLGWVILSPEEAFDSYIAEKRSAMLPVLIYTVISYSLGSLILRNISSWGIMAPLSPILGPLSYVTGVTILGVSLVNLVVYTGFVHLIAGLMGHREGRWESFIGLVGFSSMPHLIPSTLLASYVITPNPWIFFVGVTLMLVTFIWSVYMVIVAAAVNYGMDKGRAFLASVISVVLALLLLFVISRVWRW